jgi:hypothetical protein
MSTDDPRQLVIAHLERRDTIAEETRQHLESLQREPAQDALANVPLEIRRAAEDEYYARQGKQRYTTSDGRTLFLQPDEIHKRQKAKAGREKRKPRHYGANASSDLQSSRLTLGFNAGAVVLALLVVYLILH